MKPYYQDDFAVIYLGKNEDILPHLEKCDLCLTDPPYGLAEKLQGGTWGKKYNGRYSDWDAQSPNDLLEVVSKGTIQIVWGGNYHRLPPSRGHKAAVFTSEQDALNFFRSTEAEGLVMSLKEFENLTKTVALLSKDV